MTASRRMSSKTSRIVAAVLLWAISFSGLAAPEPPSPDLDIFEPGVRAAMTDALRAFGSSFDSAGDDAGRAAAWGQLGMIYQAHHLQDAARRCYEEAVELDAAEFRWQYFLGYLYQETGEYERAEDRLSDALTVDPEYLPARLRIGQVRLSRQDPDAAVEDFERVLQREPANAAALAGLGRAAILRQDYPRAIRYLESALRADPGADRLYHPLAMAYRQTGDVERARASLASHGKTDPLVSDPMLADMARLSRSSQMYLEQGYAAARAGRHAEAVESFRMAVRFNPEDAAAHVSLGQGLVLTGEVAGAQTEFERALEIDPDHPVAHYRRGTILEEKGSDEEAVADYRAALDADPGYLQAKVRLADALMRLGRYRQAAATYAGIDASGEGRAMFVYRQGMARLAAGDCGEGMKVLESARSLKPDSGEIYQALARVYAACPEADAGRRQEALDLARQLFQARPNQAHAETLAMAAAAAGQQARAVDLQTRLVEISDGRSDPFADWQKQQLERYLEGIGPASAWPDGHPVFRPERLGAGPEAPVGR